MADLRAELSEADRHEAVLHAQAMAYSWAQEAEDVDSFEATEGPAMLANMWANVAVALRKEKV